MTETERIEYEKMKSEYEELGKRMEELENQPIVYGYARVSTKKQAREGNGLEEQKKALLAAGVEEIFLESYTGTEKSRPELDKLLNKVKPGDTIVITKIDRVARSARQGMDLIDSLLDNGVKVHILNMGLIDNTPQGKLIRNVMLAFAEFERDMIVERTQEGREIARQKSGYKDGRPLKFKEAQREHAKELLKNNCSVKEVMEKTGMSRATVFRIKSEIA